MKTGITITEATEECAFLTNANGYDVAFLRRIVTQGHPDIPEAEMLTGEQWQALIDQIAIALAPTPSDKMKTELEEITRLYGLIYAELFTIEPPAGEDLIQNITALANAVYDSNGDSEDWLYVGEYTESPLLDLIPGLYWSLTEWHGGQTSATYAAMCAISQVFSSDWSPGMCSAPSAPDEETGEGADPGWYAYEALNQWMESRQANKA